MSSRELLGSGVFLGRLECQVQIGGIRVSQWTARGPAEHGAHGHEEAHFTFVTSGGYISGAEGREDAFGTPLIYNPPGVVHEDRLAAGAGSFIAISLSPLLSGRYSLRAARRLGGVRAQATARRIAAALRRGRSGDIEDRCIELLSLALEEDGEASPSRWLSQAKQALSDPFAPTPSIQQLSLRLGVHPTYLARSFARIYGCTPGEYSRWVRLSTAARIITGGHEPIGDIAARCGFADQSHLTNQLRRAYGMAPGELRRRTAVLA